jgi:MFS family permease
VTAPVRLHYGWVVLSALCITETVSWGIMYYGFAVFLRPMEQALGWSRVALTGAFSFGLLVSALAAVPVGRWIDAHGGRALMTLGSCAGAALMLAWSRVETLGVFYAIWCGLGLVLAATLYEPAFAVLVGWFEHRRDRALLILTLAAGLASTIFVPLATWLLERQGWRAALLSLGLMVAVITIPLHGLVLRRPPPRAFVREGDAETSEDAAVSMTTNEAVRAPIFWVLSAAFVVGNFATISVTVHLIPYFLERGWSMTTAATAMAWLGAMQLFGRIVFAPVATRFGHREITAAVFVVQALAMIQLALLDRLPTIVPLVVLLGAANGMATLARATIVAEIFGPRHYGSISGAMSVGSTMARAAGPVASSALRSALGGYPGLFCLLAGTLLVAGAGVVMTRADGNPGAVKGHERRARDRDAPDQD